MRPTWVSIFHLLSILVESDDSFVTQNAFLVITFNSNVIFKTSPKNLLHETEANQQTLKLLPFPICAFSRYWSLEVFLTFIHKKNEQSLEVYLIFIDN